MKIFPAAFAAMVLVGGALIVSPTVQAEESTGTKTGESGQQADVQSVIDRLDALRSEYGVTALLVGIDDGRSEPVLEAVGTSMTGIPADPRMHFRSGSMAIGSMTTILLQLVDEGVVGLDDTIDAWLPDYPDAGKVTLRMLADSNSGYSDYISDDAFLDAFEEDVFYHWTPDELLKIAFARGMEFEPGTDFHYSHANYVVLGQALSAAAGVPYDQLLQERIIDRLGLEQTVIWTTAELPDPPLHSFTTERGLLEDSTYWSPSWTSYTGSLNADLADTVQLIRALSTGETISGQGLEEMKAPTNVGMSGNTDERHFGLGMEFLGPWIAKTFAFGGYGGMAGYLPSAELVLVVVVTHGADSDIETNPASAIFSEISAMLGH